MTSIKKLLTTIVILSTVTSCAWFDSGGETIKGRYNIVWIDTKSNRSIDYAIKEGDYGGIEKVGPFVKRMGANERFIIAERIYLDNSKQMDKPNYDSVSYYIIDMSKKSDFRDDDVMGPFNKAEFDSVKLQLGIKDLEFTNEYKDY